MYKDALKMGFYQLLSARDLYQVATASEGGMHADLALRFIRVQALLITPIAPHVAEYLWSTVLHESSSVQKALFPTVSSPVDPAIADSAAYVRTKVKDIRDAEMNFAKKKAKGKGTAGFDISKPKAVKIWVAKGFPEWQDTAVEIVKGAWDGEKVDDKKCKEELTSKGLIKEKKYMPFIAQLKVRPPSRFLSSTRSCTDSFVAPTETYRFDRIRRSDQPTSPFLRGGSSSSSYALLPSYPRNGEHFSRRCRIRICRRRGRSRLRSTNCRIC